MIKIYKIVSNDSNKIYIGSTKKSLNDRLSNHKFDKKNKKCYTFKKNNILDNCQIRLIELCNESSRLIRERFWVEFYRRSMYFECINKYIPIQYNEERLIYNRNRNKNYSKIKVKCNYCEDYLNRSSLLRHIRELHPIFVMDLFN